MAQIKAGVAYVDVRLGSVEQFMGDLKKKVEDAFSQIGKAAGEKITKAVPEDSLSSLGSKLNKDLSKSFFNDAKTNFMAGFRALANSDLPTAGALFSAAGKSFGSSLTSGFKATVQAAFDSFDAIAAKAAKVGSAVSSAAQRGWAKFQEFGTVLDKAAQKMGFLSFQIQNFGIIATAVFTAPIAAATAFATVIGIKTAAQIESATNALKYLLPAGIDVANVLDRLKKIAIESPIFDTTDLIQYAQKFTAAGVEISKTERFLKAFSNIALVTGANTDEARRAVVAITQAFGKGKLQSEELNQQLGEAMPSVLKLLRDQLGVTQAELTEMVKSGKITGDDLIEIFTRIGESPKFIQGAAEGAKTLNGVWQQLKETAQTQLGTFFLDNSEQIKKALNELGPALSKLITNAGPIFLKLISGFSSLVGWFSRAVDWYNKLSPGTQNLILKLGGLATILGPIVLALGTFMGAIAGISAGVAAIATPVGGIVAAVVAVAAAIGVAIAWVRKFIAGNSEAAQKVKASWNNFYADVIGPVVDGFRSLWDGVVKAFDQIKNALVGNTGSWKSWAGFLKELGIGIWALLKGLLVLAAEVLKGIFSALGSVIKAIGSLISGVIKIFKGLTDFLAGVFTGDWSRALKGLREIWDGLWDGIIGVLYNVGEAIIRLVSGVVNGIIGFFKNLYNTLVGHSIIPDMVKLIIAWFYKLTSPIKSVFNSIASTVRSFASVMATFVSNIADKIKSAVSWFKELPGKIKSALSGATSWLYSTGKNIVQGLVNGVKSMAGYLKNAILNLIPAPVRSIVSNALGINSPSKVFKGYGKNVVQGFVLGLSGEQSNLTRSFAMFSDQPRFQQINGSPSDPITSSTSSSGLSIQNYYANENVDPWRQAEDWYFIVTSRGGAA
jgi:tape measure domain-containing protein